MPDKAVEAKIAASAGTQEGRRPTVVPAPAATDPELVERPRRRTFTAQEKLRILEETDRAARTGDIGAILRREGIYSSSLTDWRRQRDAGAFEALTPVRRGPKAAPADPLEAELTSARREIARLGQRLERAEAIIDLQKNYPPCWGSRCQRRTATKRHDGCGPRVGTQRQPHRRL